MKISFLLSFLYLLSLTSFCQSSTAAEDSLGIWKADHEKEIRLRDSLRVAADGWNQKLMAATDDSAIIRYQIDTTIKHVRKPVSEYDSTHSRFQLRSLLMKSHLNRSLMRQCQGEFDNCLILLDGCIGRINDLEMKMAADGEKRRKDRKA